MASKTKPRPFVKMYATGNDFILLDALGWTLAVPQKTAKALLNRPFGIGGDQLLLLTKSRRKDTEFKAQFFNPDGGEAEMCGNGIRAIAKYIFDNNLSRKKIIPFETKGGMRTVQQRGKHYVVNMGEPAVKGKEIGINLNGRVINRPLKMEGREFRITCCGLGNPHCVIFIERPKEFPVIKYGPMIETYHAFPRRINVEFAEVLSNTEIDMRVWERGTGETFGCGTGACATVIAAVLNGLTDREVSVNMPGGKVNVTWDRTSNEVTLAGPAQQLFSGTVEI
ncbi:MAG: diaminopimelate epimerase [Deltaproteobacteria bacterium]|nr:diaminopimelate epimerase [Deltaproteobacteria bacterium]